MKASDLESHTLAEAQEVRGILLGKGTLRVRLTLSRDEAGIPNGGNFETEHILDGTTGPVSVGGLELNFDELSPLRGSGIIVFDFATLKGKGVLSVTIRDAIGTLYQVIATDADPPFTPAVVGQPLRGLDGGKYVFSGYVVSVTPLSGNTMTLPMELPVGGVESLTHTNTNLNLDAIIAAEDPSDPKTYFDVTTPGSSADPLKGLVFDPEGSTLGRWVGSVTTYDFEFLGTPLGRPGSSREA